MDSEPVLVAFVFCDLVIKEQGTGKPSFIGVFNGYQPSSFPFAPPKFFLVCLVTNLRGKYTQLSVTARIENAATGHVVHSISGNVAVKEGYEFNGKEVFDLLFPVESCIIPSPGDYAAILLINNDKIGVRNFSVLSINPPQNQLT